MNTNLTQPKLSKLKQKELKDICQEKGLPISGKKSILVDRILEHQTKSAAKKKAADKILAEGAKKGDKNFEKVMKLFEKWLLKNKFDIFQLNDQGTNFEKLNINIVREAFAKYDPSASDLRDDHLVPVPNNPMEVFLEMFFQHLDQDWYIFDTSEKDREFDEEVTSKFVQDLKKSF